MCLLISVQAWAQGQAPLLTLFFFFLRGFIFIFLFLFFWPCHATFRILVPQPGIEPMPPVWGGQSLDSWMNREVPTHSF